MLRVYKRLQTKILHFSDSETSFQWDGSWTFSENNTWSGKGDIFEGESDVGDWEANSVGTTGFWGRFTMWWNG